MFVLPRPVAKLIENFERLPGIGPKSAARLAFYLLHVPQGMLDDFAESLQDLKKLTVTCSVCLNIGEADPCLICSQPSRDKSTICIVEQPLDIVSIERTGKFNGVYHVLHGAINPLANIGPDEIRIQELINRIKNQTTPINEIILATNPNMEGEATAMYVQREISNLLAKPDSKLQEDPALQDKSQMSRPLKITRLAHGLPMGADIEYADEITLSRSLEGRREY